MKNCLKWAALCLLAMAGLTACSEEETTLSLTLEEMQHTIPGRWVVDRAGNINSSVAGEVHIEEPVATKLEYVDINEDNYTFHFDTPVKVEKHVYIMSPYSEDVSFEEVTDLTVRHSEDFQYLHNVLEFRTEDDPEGIVVLNYTYDEPGVENAPVEYSTGLCIFGSSKDESHATSLLLNLWTGLELVRR